MELINNDLDDDNNPIEPLSKDINKFLCDVKSNKNNDKKQIKMPKRYKSTILSSNITFKSSNQEYTSNELYAKLQDLINGKETKKNINSETKNIRRSITERKNVKVKKRSNSAHKKYINENKFYKKVKYYIDIKNGQLNENNKNNNNENSLSEIFEDSPKEQNCDNVNKSQMKKNNVSNSDNKYNKKINEDERIINERKKVEEYYKKIMKSIRFNSYIDSTGKKITNNENDTDNNVMKNDSKTETNKNSDNDEKKNKKKVYQKYKSDLTPYMAFYYEKNSPFLKNNNPLYIKRKASVDIGMIHVNKGKNIKLIKEKTIDNGNCKNDNNKKNIFYYFKPEKKLGNNNKNVKTKNNKNNNNEVNNNKVNNKKVNNNNKNQYKNEYWWNIIKDKKKFNIYRNETNNSYFNGLYKVNIRDNSSWKKFCINTFISKKKDNNSVIKDFL